LGVTLLDGIVQSCLVMVCVRFIKDLVLVAFPLTEELDYSTGIA